ncbi:MAG: hypothetical protein U0T81_14400 [Saprospiraceae bacterium]
MEKTKSNSDYTGFMRYRIEPCYLRTANRGKEYINYATGSNHLVNETSALPASACT